MRLPARLERDWSPIARGREDDVEIENRCRLVPENTSTVAPIAPRFGAAPESLIRTQPGPGARSVRNTLAGPPLAVITTSRSPSRSRSAVASPRATKGCWKSSPTRLLTSTRPPTPIVPKQLGRLFEGHVIVDGRDFGLYVTVRKEQIRVGIQIQVSEPQTECQREQGRPREAGRTR